MRRRLAREIAVQALYQMEMNDVAAADAVAMIAEEASQEDERARRGPARASAVGAAGIGAG